MSCDPFSEVILLKHIGKPSQGHLQNDNATIS